MRHHRLRVCATVAALTLLSSSFAYAQNSQFLFDPNGNLQAQTSAASAPPQIIGQPQNRTVVPGESATFSVVVADTRDLSFQWKFQNADIIGATNDAVLVQNVSPSHEGEYRVVLTNPSGGVTSAPATLWIDSDADGLADSWERANFGGLSQNATADFDIDGASNLQEFLDGTSPTNRATARFQLTVLTDGDGLVDLNPTRSSYTNGETVTLTATPSGTNPFYGWSGDIQTSSNPVLLTMISNRTVLANFCLLPLEIIWANHRRQRGFEHTHPGERWDRALDDRYWKLRHEFWRDHHQPRRGDIPRSERGHAQYRRGSQPIRQRRHVP